MNKKISKHFIITGKVQGVWFRAETKKKAEQIGLTGWVKNLPNGNVEAVACGDKQALQTLEAWLQHGPELAKVISVEVNEVEGEEYDNFSVV